MNNKRGPTLEDVCRLCLEKGVRISIGIQKADVGAYPPLITIWVDLPDNSKPPVAFKTELLKNYVHMNRTLGMHLGEFVDRMRPEEKKLIIVP